MRALALVFGLALLALVAGAAFLVEAPLRLLLGWVPFLREALGRVRWQPLTVLASLAAAAAFVAGAHKAAGWLRAARDPQAPPWPLRATLALSGLLALLFLASMATLGVVHQVGWLAGADEPALRSSWARHQSRADAQAVCLSLRAALAEERPGVPPSRRATEVAAAQTRFQVAPRASAKGDPSFLLLPTDPQERLEGEGWICPAQGRVEDRLPAAAWAQEFTDFSQAAWAALDGPEAAALRGGEPVVLPDARVERLVAKSNGVAYRLQLGFPPGFEARPGRLPVVLLLDADYSFPVAHAIAVHLRERGDLPDLLLVAVGYDGPPAYKLHRTRDYTPTHVPDGGYGPEFQKASGGAPAFLDFLERELMPWLQERWRAAPRPVLVGHSYGGLFASWVQVTRPELLSGAIVVSPSLWYDQRALLALEAGLPAARRAAPGRLYGAVGGLEGSGEDMQGDLKALGRALGKARWPALEARVDVLDGETHNSVFPRALSNGLRYLWPRGSFERSKAPGTRAPGE